MKCMFSVLLSIVLFYDASFSQVFRGTVRDDKGAPLPYCNIGIPDKNIGGVSDREGHFSVNLLNAQEGDSVVFSYIGYHPKAYLVKELKLDKDNLIELISKTYALADVEVTAKRVPTILGNDSNKFRGYSGWGGISSVSEGRERGLLIALDNQSVQLSKVAIRIKHNEFDSVLLRLNLYSFSEGKPTSQLLQENHHIKAYPKDRWIYIDLLPHDVYMNEDFCLSIQWIDAWGYADGSRLTLATAKHSGLGFARESPNGEWSTVSTEITPAIYVEAYPLNNPIQTSRTKRDSVQTIETNESNRSSLASRNDNDVVTFIKNSKNFQFSKEGAKKKVGVRRISKTTDGGNFLTDSESPTCIGTLMRGVDDAYSLSELNFHLRFNTYDSLLLSFNLYTVDSSTMLPDKPFFKEGIPLRIGKEKGWVNIDLSDYEVMLDRDVFVTLRIVDALSKRNKPGALYFTKYPEGVSVYRKSREEWSTDKNSAFSFYLTLIK